MAVTSSGQDLQSGGGGEVEKENKKNRSKCPGVRVVGGRIYDSDNGKTCHQCRQKTRDFAAGCKNLKQDKQCTIKYCHKCLLNRYGEKAEEVALLDDWICPKCRGICNCSFCMKKRGHKPTGILVHTAKENGFSSVSELLQVKGPENFGYDRIVKDSGASLNKAASAKKSTVASPRKQGKENSFDENSDPHSSKLSPISNKKKDKKAKREGLQDINSGKRDDNGSLGQSVRKKPRLTEDISTNKVKIDEKDEGDVKVEKKLKKESEVISKGKVQKNDKVVGDIAVEKKPKKQSQNVSKIEVIKDDKIEGDIAVDKKPKKHPQDVSKKKIMKNEKVEVDVAVEKKHKKQSHDVSKKEGIKNMKFECERETTKTQMSRDVGFFLTANKLQETGNCEKLGVLSYVECKINKDTGELQSKQFEENIPLPSGTCLTSVAGIQLPHEDVGHALQLFEFCAAFSEVLDLKKGHAEAVIREIIFGRRARRSQSSILVQFQIKLLSLVLEDMGEETPALSTANGQTSWLKALGKYVSQSILMSKEFPPDCFDRGNERYDMLSTSQKFKLLNFLCDEALNTKDLRSWIDEQNSKFVEKEREARGKVLAAKDKEKTLKQKVQDEVAKAIIAKNGAPFSISEHDAMVSQIKKEAAQAHAEMLAAMGIVHKKRQRSDAVRTDPMFLDINGHAFWRLKGYADQSDILLQEMGNWNSDSPEEKWYVYDAEQKQGIEKYIFSLRTKRIRARKVGGIPSYGDVERNL